MIKQYGLIMCFLLFASCKAELQSSTYGFGEPYPSVFWEYVDGCRQHHYSDVGYFRYHRCSDLNCNFYRLDVWFSKKLDEADSDARRIELISELIKLNFQNSVEKIDIGDFSQKKYGPEEGKKLYEDGKKLYQECWGN
jgi:hypothetical protein